MLSIIRALIRKKLTKESPTGSPTKPWIEGWNREKCLERWTHINCGTVAVSCWGNLFFRPTNAISRILPCGLNLMTRNPYVSTENKKRLKSSHHGNLNFFKNHPGKCSALISMTTRLVFNDSRSDSLQYKLKSTTQEVWFLAVFLNNHTQFFPQTHLVTCSCYSIWAQQERETFLFGFYLANNSLGFSSTD